LIEPRSLLSNIETQAHAQRLDLLRFQYTFWFPGPNENKVWQCLHYDNQSNTLLLQKAGNKKRNNTVKRKEGKTRKSNWTFKE